MSRPNFGVGLRLIAALLLFQLIRPNPIVVTVPPQQTIRSAHPITGVHTRLADEVEPWKIAKSLELVREMGATTIVEFFPWAYYEPAQGDFNWGHPDLVIDHATAQGLTVIARLGLTPSWARPADTPLNYLDNDQFDEFATFAAAFAERYAGRVDHIIIWNEPNLSFEWGFRTTTPADYVEMLAAVYPAIKTANPNAIVLAGALAPTLEPAGSPWGLNDLDYLRGMYDAGAADYFDALAIHSYGLTFPPTSEPAPDIVNFRRTELLLAIMAEYGDGDTAIHITESGYNDHPRWTRAVRPAQRIQYTLDALAYAEAEWPTVESVSLWAFRFPAPVRSYMDYYTLVTPEFVEKPIYGAIREWNDGG